MNFRVPSRILAVSILLPLLISGCRHISNCRINNVTSFTDPDFPNPRYGTIVIYAQTDDLEWRRKLEESITSKLLGHGLTAYMGAVVLPPTRDWTAETETEALRNSKSEAVLRITISGVSIRESYVPPKTETTVGHETKVRKSGESRIIDTTEVVTTTTTGGYTERNSTTSIRLELIDLASGRRVWIATTILPASFTRCGEDFAVNLVEHLAGEKMIR